MKKIYALIVPVFLLPGFLFAQLKSISMQNIQACNGATLIASPLFGNDRNPVTLNYEKQVSAVNWVTIVTQVYDYRSNYIIITPSDISEATFYRVRAIDEVTQQEFISSGVTVNPAKWGVDIGTAFTTAIAYWGNDCNNSQNYIEATVYYSPNGRPPFTIDYKKNSDPNYTLAGTATSGMRIMGIIPNTGYTVRVTDFCGKVSLINNVRLDILNNYTIVQNATTCNNGRITINANADDRYRGIPPYRFGLGKVVADMITIVPPINFNSADVFDSLAPGDYYTQIKDACGNLSNPQFLRLDPGFPKILSATTSLPADSCYRNITVTTLRGTAPFQYGIRYLHDMQFAYQASNVFTNLSRPGVYFLRVKDACNQLSDSTSDFVSIPFGKIDSIQRLNGPSCIKDIKVFGSRGYQPYSYSIRKQDAGNFIYQTSDTLKNVGIGNYEIKIKDRCGRVTDSLVINENDAGCSLRTTAGDYESANSSWACVDYSGGNWIDAKDDSGNLIFSINPNNNFIPDLCWGIRIVSGDGSSLRNSLIEGKPTYFLDRNFYLEPQSAVTLSRPVSIRVYFTNTELQNMLSYLSFITGRPVIKDDLKILKKKASAGSPVDLEVTNDGSASSQQFTILQPVIMPFGNDWYMEFSINDFSEFNPFIGRMTPLPARLISFTAEKQKSAIQLNWLTANEINTDRYELQWATNGNSFVNIGGVPATKNLAANNYFFNHLNPATGINYYRLKQIDADGKFALSKIISTNFTTGNKIIISPNPASGHLTIQLPPGNANKVIRVFDAAGKMVLQQNIQPLAVNVELDIQQFSKGWYLLELKGTAPERIRFIKN